MATLLRNSLLATSSTIDSNKTDLTKIIPPNPNANVDQQKTTPIITIQNKSPAPSSLGDFKKIYDQLKSESGRELIGNDPLLQKNAIDKINEFLSRYPQTKASPDFNENDAIVWTDLPIKTLYYKSIQTLIDLINDISDIITTSEVDGSVTTRRKLVETFFRKERRVYVGIIFIFLSFILYFIDSAI